MDKSPTPNTTTTKTTTTTTTAGSLQTSNNQSKATTATTATSNNTNNPGTVNKTTQPHTHQAAQGKSDVLNNSMEKVHVGHGGGASHHQNRHQHHQHSHPHHQQQHQHQYQHHHQHQHPQSAQHQYHHQHHQHHHQAQQQHQQGPPASHPHGAIEVGKAMKLEQYDGSEIQGFIHAYDRASTLVCVEVIPSSETVLVCADNIKSATLVSLSKDTVRMWPNVSSMSVDGARTKTELDRVWQKKHTQWLQTNHAITMTQTGRMTVAHIKTYAQTVFDTLAKTLPCQWDNDTIIILGSVRLDPPYDTSCISGNGDNGVVNRVKMILEKESNVLNKSVDTNGVNATSTK